MTPETERQQIGVAKRALWVALNALPIRPPYSASSSTLLAIYQFLAEREREIDEIDRRPGDDAAKVP